MSHATSLLRCCFTAAALLLVTLPVLSARAQESPDDPKYLHHFYLFDDTLLIHFAYITENATTVVERQNGTRVQKVNVSTAAIEVFDRADNDNLLAVGEGNLTIHATISPRGFYDFNRIVITSAGSVEDVSGAEELRLFVHAIIIKRELRVFDLYLDPIK